MDWLLAVTEVVLSGCGLEMADTAAPRGLDCARMTACSVDGALIDGERG